MGVEYSCIEYIRDFIKIFGSARCMAIIIYVFPDVYNENIHTERI